MPLVSFCNPENLSAFLMFSGGTEQWHEMGEISSNCRSEAATKTRLVKKSDFKSSKENLPESSSRRILFQVWLQASPRNITIK